MFYGWCFNRTLSIYPFLFIQNFSINCGPKRDLIRQSRGKTIISPQLYLQRDHHGWIKHKVCVVTKTSGKSLPLLVCGGHFKGQFLGLQLYYCNFLLIDLLLEICWAEICSLINYSKNQNGKKNIKSRCTDRVW